MATPTKLLFFAGDCPPSFTAAILEVRPLNAEADTVLPAGATWGVVLDRTGFYPGGGGQPPDSGTLADLKVIEAGPAPNEPGVVLHYIVTAGGQATGLAPGQVIEATVDWERRFDLMQQHTGQHILSAVAMREWSAPTTGFHLGLQSATVDLALPEPLLQNPLAIESLIAQLERLACGEVFADHPVQIDFVAPRTTDGASDGNGTNAQLRVRERGPAPKGTETWRVIAIDSLDRSPCGGTHVATTGQVGLITVQRWEKVRDSLRLEFTCGFRALAAAAWRRNDLRRLGLSLSAPEQDAVDLTLKNLSEAAERHKELRSLRLELLRYRAMEMAADAEPLPCGLLVFAVLADLGADELKSLAASLCTAEPTMVALLASGGDVPRLVFARGDCQHAVHAGNLMSEAMGLLGGRGGGSPKLAQGGGGDASLLTQTMAAAAERVRTALRVDA